MYAKPGSRLLLNRRALSLSLSCGFPLNGAVLRVMPLCGVCERAKPGVCDQTLWRLHQRGVGDRGGCQAPVRLYNADVF